MRIGDQQPQRPRVLKGVSVVRSHGMEVQMEYLESYEVQETCATLTKIHSRG